MVATMLGFTRMIRMVHILEKVNILVDKVALLAISPESMTEHH